MKSLLMRKHAAGRRAKHFIENLDKKIEISSGKTGHEVVKVLEKVQNQITLRK